MTIRNSKVPSSPPADVDSSEEPGNLKHKRRFCKHEGCNRIVKSQGLCQRHGAKPRKCKVEGCDKQSQGNFDKMCKAHFKAMKRATTPLPKVQQGNLPPPAEGFSVYDSILPASIGYSPQKGSVMPLIAHLKEGFELLKPPAWHRNEERRARGMYPIDNPATQLEGWERELVWMEILVLTGAPGASFRHLARAWGRDKGFHMVLAQFICERQGDVQRKKRIAEKEGAVSIASPSSKSRGPAKKRRRLKKSSMAADVSADIWDDSAYESLAANEALAADIFDFSPQEFESATALQRWKHIEDNSDTASMASQRSMASQAATAAILGDGGGKIMPKPSTKRKAAVSKDHPEESPQTSALALDSQDDQAHIDEAHQQPEHSPATEATAPIFGQDGMHLREGYHDWNNQQHDFHQSTQDYQQQIQDPDQQHYVPAEHQDRHQQHEHQQVQVHQPQIQDHHHHQQQQQQYVPPQIHDHQQQVQDHQPQIQGHHHQRQEHYVPPQIQEQHQQVQDHQPQIQEQQQYIPPQIQDHQVQDHHLQIQNHQMQDHHLQIQDQQQQQYVPPHIQNQQQQVQGHRTQIQNQHSHQQQEHFAPPQIQDPDQQGQYVPPQIQDQHQTQIQDQHQHVPTQHKDQQQQHQPQIQNHHQQIQDHHQQVQDPHHQECFPAQYKEHQHNLQYHNQQEEFTNQSQQIHSDQLLEHHAPVAAAAMAQPNHEHQFVPDHGVYMATQHAPQQVHESLEPQSEYQQQHQHDQHVQYVPQGHEYHENTPGHSYTHQRSDHPEHNPETSAVPPELAHPHEHRSQPEDDHGKGGYNI